MRNGGKAIFRVEFKQMEPPPAVYIDPGAPIEFEMRVPDGTETVWVSGVDAEVVHDATGKFHVEQVLDYVKGGTYVFLARAPDFPETRSEVFVEPAYW